MDGKNSNNYISLQEATKYCNHSQEYLALRARQGKLKAVKFDQNWITKKEWLEMYLERVEEYKNKSQAPPSLFLDQPFIKKKIASPENLPIKKTPALRFSFLVLLVFTLLITIISFNKSFFQNVFKPADRNLASLSGDIFNSGGSTEKVEEQMFVQKLGGEGIMIIPSTEKDIELKEKIKASFSDEVRVEPIDKTSGVITPILKGKEGEKYLYVSVPIKN